MKHLPIACRARFLGVTPNDIRDYGLEDATHPLTRADIKRGQDAIRNDPFFAAYPEWIAAIEQLLAMGVTRYLKSMLYDVKADDPVTIAVVGTLLVLVALAACFLPAQRATNVDPMVALRYE